MKRLKTAFKMDVNSSLRLLVAVASFIVISSCGNWTTTVTEEEARQAGITIGRIIRGE